MFIDIIKLQIEALLMEQKIKKKEENKSRYRKILEEKGKKSFIK